MNPFVLALALCATDVYQNPNTFQTPRLEVGQPPPPLRATEWIGAPITSFEKGRVYVVEFWATWCEPCRRSLPELKALARARAKDKLTVIGVAAAETDGVAPVKELTRRLALGYPIAFADDQSPVFDQWMHGARNTGLPWVFIIDRQQRLAWWGQPFDADFAPTLEAVLASTHSLVDLKRAIDGRVTKLEPGWQLLEAVRDAEEKKNWASALPLYAQLVQLDPERFWWEASSQYAALLELKDASAGAMGRQLVSGVSKDNAFALERIGVLAQGVGDSALAELALVRAVELTRSENVTALEHLAELRVSQDRMKDARALLTSALRFATPTETQRIKRNLATLTKSR